MIPDLALPLLTWRQLERKVGVSSELCMLLLGNASVWEMGTAEPERIEQVCGTPVIDVDRLESTTAYSNCDKNHEVIQRFWKVTLAPTHLFWSPARRLVQIAGSPQKSVTPCIVGCGRWCVSSSRRSCLRCLALPGAGSACRSRTPGTISRSATNLVF